MNIVKLDPDMFKVETLNVCAKELCLHWTHLGAMRFSPGSDLSLSINSITPQAGNFQASGNYFCINTLHYINKFPVYFLPFFV